MKKIRKVFLIICIILIAALFIGSVINHYISKKNFAKYAGYYGTYCETEHGRINYSVTGSGKDTIVIVPGLGSASPYYEFSEVVDVLKDKYKVIVIEPLGYGLSDETKASRTTDNICAEIHEVISSIGEKEYYIMGHSISGIYALNYCNLYKDEVRGFIGIDASIPAQITEESPFAQYLSMKLTNTLLVKNGLYRVLNGELLSAPNEMFENPQYQGTPFAVFKNLNQEDRAVYLELISSRTMNATVTNEVKCLKENCEQEMEYSFPESIPVLYILAKDTIDSDLQWEKQHQDLTGNNSRSKVTVMEGSHYLHICDAKKLCENVINWLEQ